MSTIVTIPLLQSDNSLHNVQHVLFTRWNSENDEQSHGKIQHATFYDAQKNEIKKKAIHQIFKYR